MFNYKIKNLTFSGRIIDCHVHFSPKGKEKDFYGNDVGEAALTNALEIANLPNNTNNDSVEKALVTNLSCIDTQNHLEGAVPNQNETVGNTETINLCKKNKKLLPVAVCQPGHGSSAKIKELLSSNKFYALKFHPYYLGIVANDRLYDPYLEVAEKMPSIKPDMYKNPLPCVFHSAFGKSNPQSICELAKRHPNVPIVLYHSTLETNDNPNNKHEDAIRCVENAKQKNIYLELSWVDQDVVSNKIVEMINRVGEDRILFGTDASLGDYGKTHGNRYYLDRVNKLKQKIRDNFEPTRAEKIIDKIFYLNSKNLFGIE